MRTRATLRHIPQVPTTSGKVPARSGDLVLLVLAFEGNVGGSSEHLVSGDHKKYIDVEFTVVVVANHKIEFRTGAVLPSSAGSPVPCTCAQSLCSRRQSVSGGIVVSPRSRSFCVQERCRVVSVACLFNEDGSFSCGTAQYCVHASKSCCHCSCCP